MSRRALKRLACFRVALLIEAALGGGWEVEGVERERFERAVLELRDELIRRGHL